MTGYSAMSALTMVEGRRAGISQGELQGAISSLSTIVQVCHRCPPGANIKFNSSRCRLSCARPARTTSDCGQIPCFVFRTARITSGCKRAGRRPDGLVGGLHPRHRKRPEWAVLRRDRCPPGTNMPRPGCFVWADVLTLSSGGRAGICHAARLLMSLTLHDTPPPAAATAGGKFAVGGTKGAVST